MKLDILAFGVHPDDVELGCSGTIMAAAAEGKKVGVVDLTKGELGTRGTAETRLQESAKAAEIMGVLVRENLEMADGFFVHDEAHLRKVITVIRKYQPEIILCNAPEDRHPDHGRSAKLVADAAFLAGLRKIETTDNEIPQEKWRPTYVFHYIQDRFIQPSFVIDISAYMSQKIEAVLAYATQFYKPDVNLNEPQTYISSPQFLETVKARAMMLGKRIGVEYAEGFISEKVLGIRSFDAIVKNVT
ncbi:MAG: bacillithiol biosynthesis deacetylase BshB1 [Hydrotalea flava]|uniref:bacillithiol biosynthesis deacetylase BshB1 n=1 Tax=Hydrotalea TaxID=1004300 RepID=UPI0016ADDFA9|nr:MULTISPECIES: bacillithiol biosynthesis deacetylase BshB1 [Hydrotalea]MBY0347670.1 bacillithiol biosynthesis deacetylase BshB1 [Hydrotalea flava]GHT98220.1 bacillithiol biosynthesis deacetylase BshB1 [Alphaproteobacteria bacterium]GHU81441.1 bacillithiol biosynthesis deacetylase BshB1 [Spirochaetia bacterium]NIM35337.1 bacillithiol biosynthesis deacetylase BshB1 [Hydrotalea flava]NIM38196.1 bacillithiol biosynthesis deacetylase BshB1 [Hydrotalea flava]